VIASTILLDRLRVWGQSQGLLINPLSGFPTKLELGLLLKNTITRYNFRNLKNPAQNHTECSTNFLNQPETPIEFQHDLARIGTEILGTQ
jgi:hypothetical protein